jgi:hypothetical protein
MSNLVLQGSTPRRQSSSGKIHVVVDVEVIILYDIMSCLLECAALCRILYRIYMLEKVLLVTKPDTLGSNQIVIVILIPENTLLGRY